MRATCLKTEKYIRLKGRPVITSRTAIRPLSQRTISQKDSSKSDLLRILIGSTKLFDASTKSKRPYKYSDVPTQNGWVLDFRYIPVPFDLLQLRIAGSGLIVSGWWDGQAWQGMRLKPQHFVSSWKRVIAHD